VRTNQSTLLGPLLDTNTRSIGLLLSRELRIGREVRVNNRTNRNRNENRNKLQLLSVFRRALPLQFDHKEEGRMEARKERRKKEVQDKELVGLFREL
jgi:hypothetical protein